MRKSLTLCKWCKGGPSHLRVSWEAGNQLAFEVGLITLAWALAKMPGCLPEPIDLKALSKPHTAPCFLWASRSIHWPTIHQDTRTTCIKTYFCSGNQAVERRWSVLSNGTTNPQNLTNRSLVYGKDLQMKTINQTLYQALLLDKLDLLSF